jgi:DNA-binding GntR family transcriptional regulator
MAPRAPKPADGTHLGALSRPSDESALSALPPRDTTALVRMVRDRLRTAITFGELAPGTRLNQVQVASQLGVSRMPVRYAVADLQAEGLLDPLPSGGAVVRALTQRDMRDVYEVRTALEAQAARHVAERTEDLEEIFAVLEDHAALGGTSAPAALLELDRRFHMAILDASGNPSLRRAMLPIWSVVERAMVGMLVTIPEMFVRAWKEHAAIADALRAGDPELAEALMRRHLEFAAAQLAHSMPESE